MTNIVITTSPIGLKLYESASNNLDFYIKHLELINLRITQIDKLFETFPDFRENESFKNLYFQLEFNGLLTISILDLSLISREIFISKKTWEKLYYAKQTYLVIYETINSYNKHNKTLNDLSLKISQTNKNRLDKISKEIKAFKKRYSYSTEICDIRNKVAGHINENFKIYLSTLKLIDIENTGEMLKDFVIILTSLQKYSTDLLIDYGKIIDDEKKLTDERVNSTIDKIIELLNINNR